MIWPILAQDKKLIQSELGLVDRTMQRISRSQRCRLPMALFFSTIHFRDVVVARSQWRGDGGLFRPTMRGHLYSVRR